MQRIVRAIQSWDETLMGGFPEQGQHPFENASDATEAYFVDDWTLEHPLPTYIGAEDAFSVLLCMVTRFHLKCAIAQVTIE